LRTTIAIEQYQRTGTALSRLLSEAPYLPRCSDNKTATRVRPREYAVRYPYMQVNRPGMVSWLIFDLDHSNPLIWEEEGLPTPNLVVTNRKNGHSHLYYAIPPVCTSEHARSGPIQYMRAVYEAMAARLRADPSYSGPVAKTPGHPWWSTWEIHNHEYELGELADYVELTVKPWSTGPDLDAVSHSRHCLLFEDLRFYAYSIVNREREQGTYTSFNRLLEVYAFNKNNFRKHGFAMNLTASQVKATVKSVSRWTWDCYTGNSRCHRGVMNFDKSLPLKERQRLSAERTHRERQKSTESKIRSACKTIQKNGDKITQIAIAVESGLSRQTVANYKHILSEAFHTTAQNSNVIQMEAASIQPRIVKRGVHQIPAKLSGDSDDVLTQLMMSWESVVCAEPPD